MPNSSGHDVCWNEASSVTKWVPIYKSSTWFISWWYIFTFFFFRDSNTRSDFVNMARFFGCMDQCDQQNMLQRIILFAPVIALCKYCKYCRPFNNFLFKSVFTSFYSCIPLMNAWKEKSLRMPTFCRKNIKWKNFFSKGILLARG